MTFEIVVTILGVKHDADFENGVCMEISPRLGLLFVGCYVNGMVIRKISFLPLESYSVSF